MKSKLRRMAKMLAIMFLFLMAGANAWGEQVVTIYFCGTGIKSDAYLAENTSWKVDPELLSTMFLADGSVEIQQGPYQWLYGVWTPQHPAGSCTASHHKYIVNGVGTSPDSNVFEFLAGLLGNVFGTVDPNLGTRTWNNIVVEAQTALNEVYHNHPGEFITLNLVGYSRGCISAMQVARSVKDWDCVNKINILVYDPVPGGFDPIGVFDTDFHLISKVNQYVGLYAEHERTYQFEPVIPTKEYGNTTTKMLTVRVPGSHETLVGNHQIDGHFLTLFQFHPHGFDPGTRDPNFHYVKDMSRVIAEQLLTSDEWGNVPLDIDTAIGTGGVDSKAEFTTLVSNMWAQDYSYIPIYAFAPVWGTYDGPYSLVGRDHNLRILVPWTTSYHGRLCFESPHRHLPEWLWPFPWFFPNAEQVYWLDSKVPRIAAATWETLQSFRGGDFLDNTDPVPDVDPLPTITGDCSVLITSQPTATDNIVGLIHGTTTDPLTYSDEGTYTITWTYDDENGNTTIQEQTVIVADTIPPIPDEDPLPTVGGQCSAEISFIPTASDCSGIIKGTTNDPLSYTEQGTYTVTWTYDDENGNTTIQEQTVIVRDTTPPMIESLTASPNILWPPNHKMVPVVIDVNVSDNCNEVPICRITSVSSNESENSLGDGNKVLDWEITGDQAVNLRAERCGTGSDRVYTITVECLDAVGNSSTNTVRVTVPHDQGRKLRKMVKERKGKQ